MPNIINGMTAENFIKDINTHAIDNRGGFQDAIADTDGKYPEDAFPIKDEKGEIKMVTRKNNNIAEVKYLKSNDPNFLFPQIQEETEDWILVTDNYQNTGGKLFKRNTAWLSKEHQDGLFFPMELRTNPRNSFKLVYDKPGTCEFTLPRWVSEYDCFMIDGGYHGLSKMYTATYYNKGYYARIAGIDYGGKKEAVGWRAGEASDYNLMDGSHYFPYAWKAKNENRVHYSKGCNHFLTSFTVTVGAKETPVIIEPNTEIWLATSGYNVEYVEKLKYTWRQIQISGHDAEISSLTHGNNDHTSRGARHMFCDYTWFGKKYFPGEITQIMSHLPGTLDNHTFGSCTLSSFDEKYFLPVPVTCYVPWYQGYQNFIVPSKYDLSGHWGCRYNVYDSDSLKNTPLGYGEDGVDVMFKINEDELDQNTYNATPGNDGAVILYF